jgi:site-specific recombinase XerD
MVDRGADVRDVQKILGHQSVAVTELYTSGAVLHLAEAVDGRWYGPR